MKIIANTNKEKQQQQQKANKQKKTQKTNGIFWQWLANVQKFNLPHINYKCNAFDMSNLPVKYNIFIEKPSHILKKGKQESTGSFNKSSKPIQKVSVWISLTNIE